MATFSGFFFNNNKRPSILGLLNPPIVPQGSYVFKNATGSYSKRTEKLLGAGVLTSIAQQPKPAEKTTLL